MDNLDKRLLSLLRENARLPTARLARELGVTRSTVQGRIDRLLRRGVISRFTIDQASGHEASLVRAHVLIKVDQQLTARVQIKLQKEPSITAIFAVSGEYDLIVVAAAHSTGELNQLLDAIAAIEGVVRTNSSVILEEKLRR